MKQENVASGKIVLTAPGMQASDCCADHDPSAVPTGGSRKFSRWQLLAMAAVPAGASLYLGWPWLVAAGAAPFILAVAPCAVMCAVGICAMPGRKSPASSEHVGVTPRSRN